MRYLGIDYGTKRIGVAVSDETGSIAFPLGTVDSGPKALSEVVMLIKENGAQKIIIGESRDNRGAPNEVQEDIEQFKKDITELTGLPTEYEREFFSSTQAARQFAPDSLSADGRRSRKENPSQAKLDASAAALILQSFLDKIKNNGTN